MLSLFIQFLHFNKSYLLRKKNQVPELINKITCTLNVWDICLCLIHVQVLMLYYITADHRKPEKQLMPCNFNVDVQHKYVFLYQIPIVMYSICKITYKFKNTHFNFLAVISEIKRCFCLYFSTQLFHFNNEIQYSLIDVLINKSHFILCKIAVNTTCINIVFSMTSLPNF